MADKIEQTKKVWTKEEILKMWPQAAGELRGFQRALEAKAGLTAAQLGIALQLAEEEFKRLKEVVYTFNIYRATTPGEAVTMFKEGKDPVILQYNAHEIGVYTKIDGPVAERIYHGANWHMSEGAGVDEGYEVFTFTRLNFDKIIEHLSDPTKFNAIET